MSNRFKATRQFLKVNFFTFCPGRVADILEACGAFDPGSNPGRGVPFCSEKPGQWAAFQTLFEIRFGLNTNKNAATHQQAVPYHDANDLDWRSIRKYNRWFGVRLIGHRSHEIS